MDLEPRLKRAVLRLRDALHAFAKKKGWPSSDYRIFMRANIVWDNILVDLVAKAFDPIWFKENPVYDEILDYLEQELADEPGLYESVNLIINPFTGYWFQGQNSLGENYVDIDDKFLNPNVEDIRPVTEVS